MIPLSEGTLRWSQDGRQRAHKASTAMEGSWAAERFIQSGRPCVWLVRAPRRKYSVPTCRKGVTFIQLSEVDVHLRIGVRWQIRRVNIFEFVPVGHEAWKARLTLRTYVSVLTSMLFWM